MDPSPGRGPAPGQILGHYRLVERIGAGGMGEVWRARDERLERDVALKLLLPGTLADEASRKRFRREALALSKLAHPNIATIFDFDTQDGLDFLVMEYVAGPVVTERLAQGPFEEADVARLGLELAEGLAAAHAQGIIHRDLKPGNVRLTPDGRLKILDFGLARLAGPEGGRSRTESLTEAQALVGTLAYMAPEQVRGEPADARSDLWSAGLVLYELATGKRAYGEERSAQVLYSILNQTPPAPRTLNGRVSAGLEAIVLRCLEREPARRYADAAMLAADLRRLQGGLTVEAERMRARARRGRWLVLAAPVAGVALIALLTALNVGGLRDRMTGRGAPIRSVVVLPLANLTGDPGQEYFADGMTAALINDLCKVEALRTISSTTAMRYKGSRKGLAEIAKELGVDAVVEGSVQRSGGRVKINAQLIRTAGEKQLWAESYERDLRDLLVLQGEMAGTIAGAVKATVTPADRARLAKSRRKVDPRAYEAYLRGRAQMDSMRFGRARKSFAEAVAIDSTFAPAWAGLSRLLTATTFYGGPPGPVAMTALDAAATALRLDPGLGEAHSAMGMARLAFAWDWRTADAETRRALELNPNSHDANYDRAGYLCFLDRAEEAVPLAKRNAEATAWSQGDVVHLAWVQMNAGRYAEAISTFHRGLSLNPRDGLSWGFLCLCHAYAGQKERAIALTDSLLAEKRIPAWDAMLAYANSGARAKALDLLRKLEKYDTEKQDLTDPLYYACGYAAIGDADAAFAWLKKGLDGRYMNMINLNSEPSLRPLRSDPRYEEIRRAVGLPSPRD